MSSEILSFDLFSDRRFASAQPLTEVNKLSWSIVIGQVRNLESFAGHLFSLNGLNTQEDQIHLDSAVEIVEELRDQGLYVSQFRYSDIYIEFIKKAVFESVQNGGEIQDKSKYEQVFSGLIQIEPAWKIPMTLSGYLRFLNSKMHLNPDPNEYIKFLSRVGIVEGLNQDSGDLTGADTWLKGQIDRIDEIQNQKRSELKK